jgi:hypothetical protein
MMSVDVAGDKEWKSLGDGIAMGGETGRGKLATPKLLMTEDSRSSLEGTLRK